MRKEEAGGVDRVWWMVGRVGVIGRGFDMSRCGRWLGRWLVVMLTMGVVPSYGATVLTLDEAIDIALEQSYASRRLRLNLFRSKQAMKAARARTRTQVNLNLDAPNFYEQVQDVRIPNQLPTYNTIGRIQWGGRLVVEQPVVLTNTTLSITTDVQQFRESVFDDLLNTTEKEKRLRSQFVLSIRQPLLVPNSQKLALERAELQLELAQRSFTRTQLDVVYSVTQAFYSLYRSTRQHEIAQEEETRQETSYDLAQRKHDAGLIPEVEALQMEVALAESKNKLLQADGDVSRSSDQFKLALGLMLEDDVGVRTDFSFTPFAVDEAKAVAHGRRHRAEIREDEIDRRLAAISLMQTRANNAISGEVSAYYDRTGVSDPEFPYETYMDELLNSSLMDLRRRPRNLGVRFSLKVPIWDWGTSDAEVLAARAFLQQREVNLEEQQQAVARDIRSVIARLREAEGRLEVLKKSEGVAQRSYDINLARFENGDITARELSDAHESLTRARQSYLDAYIQYQLAVADLKRRTLYDFENDKSLVEDAD
jgi:outer membrane protein